MVSMPVAGDRHPRMAFWDDMTGPGFWEVHSAPNDIDDDAAHGALIYQLR